MATHQGYTIFTGASVTCNSCGGLVTNTVIHDEWHAQIGRALHALQKLQEVEVYRSTTDHSRNNKQ